MYRITTLNRTQLGIIWLVAIGSYAIIIHNCIISLLQEVTYLPILITVLSICLALVTIINVNVHTNYKVWQAICCFQLAILFISGMLFNNNSTEDNKEIFVFSFLALAAEIGLAFFSFILRYSREGGSKKPIGAIELNSILIDTERSEDRSEGEEGVEECSVCLQPILEDSCQIQKCNHAFHKECVSMWLKRYSPTCPMCRESVM